MSLTHFRNCVVCGGPLTGQQRKFDKPECSKEQSRWDWVYKTYGLTKEQYEAILEFQGGMCGCCGKAFKPDSTPHIDHEHGGHVRGIVHAYCNTRLIGRLKSADTAQRLADYLREPPAVTALGGPVIAPGRPPKKRVYRRKRK